MRKKILLLVLLGVTILWLVAWFGHVAAYNHMIDKKKQQIGEEYVEKFYDYPPVWVWSWGRLYLLIGLFISMGWIVSIYEFVKGLKKRTNGRSKIMPLMASGIIVMLVTISVNFGYVTQVEATPEEDFHYCVPNSIDLLFVSDEELRAQKELVIVPWKGKVETWYSTRKIEEIIFPRLRNRFLEQTGISLAFNGWVEWDSDDDEHYRDLLLVEAMEETQWVAQEVYRERSLDAYGFTFTDEHRRMDILVVLTDQSTDGIGFAMTQEAAVEVWGPWLGKNVSWDSCILKHQVGGDIMIQLLAHEITHLFGAPDPYYGFPHCSNLDCMMNPTWVVEMQSYKWCSSCRTKLIAWVDIVPSEQYPPC